MQSGVILSTGNAVNAVGPNTTLLNDGNNAWTGDSDLEATLAAAGIPMSSANATVLEFDFTPISPNFSFDFIFASEEYPEYVNNPNFNDVFGFFLSGPGIAGPYSNGAVNIALVPTTTTATNVVSISNVNGGYAALGCPFVVPAVNPSNQQYYVNNCGGTSIQYDGFTTVLTATYPVECGQTYHIKLAIANVRFS